MRGEPSRLLKPYSSEYEGYMGNYGNTVGHWYRRAAVVMLPREYAFEARAAASNSWALQAVAESLRAGALERARARATALVESWWRPVPADSLNTALIVAAGLDDAALALALLAPYQPEMLTPDSSKPLANLWSAYPASWWSSLRAGWDGPPRRAAPGREDWIASTLDTLARRLRATGTDAAADWLVSWARDWLTESVHGVLELQNVSRRDEQLIQLGPAVAATLAAADTQDPSDLGTAVSAAGASGVPLMLSVLRSAAPESTAPVLERIARVAREQLERVVATPQRATDDWSITWTSPGGDDADHLAEFLNSSSRRTFAWPLAAPRRRCIHYLIDDAGLPVTHTTRREGRPYALVLTKTKALHTQAREARRRAEQDLAWLQTSWPR
ncbi:hypothetical protein GCM10028820_13940 [Tessaracoccus terricola]